MNDALTDSYRLLRARMDIQQHLFRMANPFRPWYKKFAFKVKEES